MVESCKIYGDLACGRLLGPGSTVEQNVFVPNPVDTRNVSSTFCNLLNNINFLLVIFFYFLQPELTFSLLFLGHTPSLSSYSCSKTC